MDDKKYILTTEELVAWKNEIQDVKKLEQEEREIAIKLNGSLPKIEDKKFNSYNLPIAKNTNLPPINILKFGDLSGINNSMQKKIIKGEYKIDAKLDLHGYSRNEAYGTLMDFLNNSYQRKFRMLLVITGKGLNSPDPFSTIKESFFGWIQTWKMQDNFLYVNYAHNKHGGDGAFYILLKKQSS
jgi:DNA-nicking Smr family endonuclease